METTFSGEKKWLEPSMCERNSHPVLGNPADALETEKTRKPPES
jgi:hypothetical protein